MGTNRCTICAGVLLLLLSCSLADSTSAQETYAIPYSDGKLAKALALYAQGLYFLHEGAASSNLVQAVASFRQAVEVDPDSVDARVALVESLVALDDRASALAEQLALSRQCVTNAEFWLLTADLASEYLNAEVFTESILALSSRTSSELASAELDRFSVGAAAVIGWIRCGNFDNSRKALRDLVESVVKTGVAFEDSTVRSPLEVVVDVATELSALPESREKIWDYISDVRALPGYSAGEHDFLVKLASVYSQAKPPDLELVSALGMKALEAEPLNFRTVMLVVFPSVNSMPFRNPENFAEAVANYSHPAKLEFSFSMLRLEFFLFVGNFPAASQELDQLRALRILNHSHETMPEEYYLYGAAVLDELGRRRECLAFLEEGLAESPTRDSLMNSLAYTFALEGRDLDRALELIDQALKRSPENIAYLDTLGWVLYKRGDYEGALRSLSQALSFGALQNHEIYDHIGDVLIKLGRGSESPAWWAKSYSIKPVAAVADKLRQAGVDPARIP